MSKHFDYSKHSRIYFMSKNMHINRQNLGVAVGFGSSCSINGSDETLGCESLWLSRVRSIKDRALRFDHIGHEEEALRDLVPSIVNQHIRFLDGSSNLGHYNSLDEQLGLIHFIKGIVVHSDVAHTPQLK